MNLAWQDRNSCVTAECVKQVQSPPPRYAMRQIVPLPSSLTSNDPSWATAIPTGRAHTAWSEATKPVRKSSYSPFGLPLAKRSRIPF